MRILMLLAAVSVLPICASAGLISTLPDGAVTTTFDGGASCGPSGARTVTDAGFSMSSDGDACFSYSGFRPLDDNGIWTGMPLISDYSGATTITIDLGRNVSYVGGFMNFAEFFDSDTFNIYPEGNDPTIAALDSQGNLIESIDIFYYIAGEYIDVNDGRFLGISESTSDIRYFQISGSGITMGDLSMPVDTPEPATMMLSVSGLAALGFLRRRSCSALDIPRGR